MNARVDQIVEETKTWPDDQVADLFERFLAANYRLPDPELDEVWATEIQRRVKEVEDGTAQLIPAEEVMERLRRIVDR